MQVIKISLMKEKKFLWETFDDIEV